MVRCDGATVSLTFPGQQIGECDQIVPGTVFVTGVSPQALGALVSGATLRHLCVRTARVAEGLPPTTCWAQVGGDRFGDSPQQCERGVYVETGVIERPPLARTDSWLNND